MFDYLDEKLETVLGKKMGKFWRIILEECADDKTARLKNKKKNILHVATKIQYGQTFKK